MKSRSFVWLLLSVLQVVLFVNCLAAEDIQVQGKPARLELRPAGQHGIRISLLPDGVESSALSSPMLLDESLEIDAVVLREIDEATKVTVAGFEIRIHDNPLTVEVHRESGEVIQRISFLDDGRLAFEKSDAPILGLGEGGPQPPRRGDWRRQAIQFDRNKALHEMIPRWETNAYGSRNPVALLVGTEGWGILIASPWGQIDLREDSRGFFEPWQPPDQSKLEDLDRREQQQLERSLQGRPPVDQITPGLLDVFVFDAVEPTWLMSDLATISGAAVLPPKWALGYMQSHRELQDSKLSSEELLLSVVDTFREKQLPLDAVVYLGTGFTPTGWNTPQPSFDFNPKVFDREPNEVIDDLHERNVRVILHIVPWHRDRLPTLRGSIPVAGDEQIEPGHIKLYWDEHKKLVEAGVDAWWPDEGDWFDLHERMKRHQLYYQGPLSTQPNQRPWSLHRNGHLGIAKWGGWVWSGDTQSSWKTLEGQIAVGINHSLSLSPFWGSDTGGFYAGIDPAELSGELYARWFQFSAFCPSFRSHGRIWRLRTPYGWGLSEMGDTEGQRFPPSEEELNNPEIETVCRKYAELRYRLLSYTYTLAAEARETGMPMMRALWLHYPSDQRSLETGDQYLWGEQMLIAPVYEKGATSRSVYLPPGEWYDFWSNSLEPGSTSVERKVDLETMPIFVRKGSIIPFEPVRQYSDQEVDEPVEVRVYTGNNATYRWYQDDGISQDYLDGKYAWIRFEWNDESQVLSIRKEDGELVLKPQRLRVRLLPSNQTREVEFRGEAMQVEF